MCIRDREKKAAKKNDGAEKEKSMAAEIWEVIRSRRKPKEKKPPKVNEPNEKKKSQKHRARKAAPESRFLNPVAEYLPVDKIENGIIYTKDHRYVKIVEVVPINFLLRSPREQRSIIYSFISYLKISPVKMQFKVLTKRADINRHVEIVHQEMEQETDPHCRILQEDYLKLIDRLGSREATTRRFFIIFEYEALGGRRGNEENEAIASLQTAARTAVNYLKQCGNEVLTPDNEDEFTVEALYSILCRQNSSRVPLPVRVQEILTQYLAAGKSTDDIPCTAVSYTHLTLPTT